MLPAQAQFTTIQCVLLAGKGGEGVPDQSTMAAS
ncbi:hypothetical protein N182_34215 [Sinorhizobium sp. GL2]|nr:hypothetical protein N182_34215 [Sinorhizobium sp. GL2]